MGKISEDNRNHSVCTECQRRKQKCNRVWPCNGCQKRKVAHKCRYSSIYPCLGTITQELRGKRQYSHDDTALASDSLPWDHGTPGREVLSPITSHCLSSMIDHDSQSRVDVPNQQQYFMDAASCPQLAQALQVLSSRGCIDAIVQNYITNVHYHCYVLYPPSFLDEYRDWWASRSYGKSLGLQWTCLLLIVCACSLLEMNDQLQRLVDIGPGEASGLASLFHKVARELYGVVPPSHNHILSVQFLLQSCYWHKSQARFVESWHFLAAAIRQAQALDIHQSTGSNGLSEFEQEMERRIWSFLNVWDWQLSILLSRPTLIERAHCDLALPNLMLEGYLLSPLLPTTLLSDLVTKLSCRFSLPNKKLKASDINEYQSTVLDWTRTFPPNYSLNDPDRSGDGDHIWIVSHRHYLHMMTYWILLIPLRCHFGKSMSCNSPPAELRIRSHGIDYCLKLMDALYGMFDNGRARGGDDHQMVQFCLLDACAMLCSALLHDADGTVPRRTESLCAIDKGIAIMKQLNTTKAAQTSYAVIHQLSQQLGYMPTSSSLSSVNVIREDVDWDIQSFATADPLNCSHVGGHSAYRSCLGSYLCARFDDSVNATPPRHSLGRGFALEDLPESIEISVARTDPDTELLATQITAPIAIPPCGWTTPCLIRSPPAEHLSRALEFGSVTQQDLTELAHDWASQDYPALIEANLSGNWAGHDAY